MKVLKIAPTSIAAINIDGTTINTALGIFINSTLNIHKLNDNLIRCKLREKYSELAMVIIDEISMVSNTLLYHIHYAYVGLEIPFAGLTILAVGDLYQLNPIRATV